MTTIKPRDGDKKQARQTVNRLVRRGLLPHPDSLPCSDCGQAAIETGHQYDHHLGYAAEHHADVEAVCPKCHARRDSPKARQTRCLRGHDFDAKNTLIRRNGTRLCRECRRNRERTTRQRIWRPI